MEVLSRVYAKSGYLMFLDILCMYVSFFCVYHCIHVTLIFLKYHTILL